MDYASNEVINKYTQVKEWGLNYLPKYRFVFQFSIWHNAWRGSFLYIDSQDRRQRWDFELDMSAFMNLTPKFFEDFIALSKVDIPLGTE